MATALESIDEDYDDSYPTLPNRVKPWRGRARSSHASSIKAVYVALRLKEDKEQVRAKRGTVVLAYEEVVRHHDMTCKLICLSPELAALEARWLEEVSTEYTDATAAVDSYLDSFPKPTTSIASSCHSQELDQPVRVEQLF